MPYKYMYMFACLQGVACTHICTCVCTYFL